MNSFRLRGYDVTNTPPRSVDRLKKIGYNGTQKKRRNLESKENGVLEKRMTARERYNSFPLLLEVGIVIIEDWILYRNRKYEITRGSVVERNIWAS